MSKEGDVVLQKENEKPVEGNTTNATEDIILITGKGYDPGRRQFSLVTDFEHGYRGVVDVHPIDLRYARVASE
jgi:hypothetical protein